MRKNLNKATVIGRIFEHTLEKKTSKKGIDYIAGKVSVAVDEEGLNVVDVNFTYVAEFYPAKEGQAPKKNKNYPVLQNIIDNGKTWSKDGKDAAMMVKFDSASIGVNNFVGRDGNMVAAPRVEGSFVTVLTKLPDVSERNEFSTDIIINRVTSMEDAEGNDLGYDEVAGRIFVYPGMAVPVTFAVRIKEGRDYFEGLDASNNNLIYTNVRGKIESITKTTQVVEESAFGGNSVKTKTTTSKAFVIEKANPVPFDLGSEDTMTMDEVAQAVQAYEVHLAEVQKNHDDYVAGQAGGNAAPKSAAAPAQKAQFAGF